MEVDCPELGDEDSDTTESGWGSDLENNQEVVCVCMYY